MNYVLVFVYSAFTSLVVAFLISWAVSCSVAISNLNKLDKEWRKTLDGVVAEFVKHFNELKKHIHN